MTAVGTHRAVHPVTLEVIRSALPAISDEMAYVLYRTSYNMMINEVRDYCTALLSPSGELISQNVGGVSHFVADLGVVIRDGVGCYGLDGFAPGDVILTNHQRVAGQHLNNVIVYMPVFHEHQLTAFTAVRAHWVDIGGYSTGFGGVGAYDPWSEGLQIDQLKIHEAGEPDRKALKLIADNIRYPDASIGDLRAQIGACELGSRRYRELLANYGPKTIERSIQTIFAEAEQRCRARVATIPDGSYRARSAIDATAPQGSQLQIDVEVTVAGSDMTIDLSRCPQQDPQNAMNSRTFAAPYIAYKALTEPLAPVSQGSFSALEVILPEGNMMMAHYPALMSDWSSPLPTVVDTILLALAPALPAEIPAAHSARLGPELVFFGEVDGRAFIAQGIEGGGWGGRPSADGMSVSVSVCQGDVRNAPIEKIELQNPVLVEERAFAQDSGGAGQHRGGLGVRLHTRALAAGRWYVDGGFRTSCPPWGLWGGGPGAPSTTAVKVPGAPSFEPKRFPEMLPVEAGTEIIMTSAGGGGWGKPWERAPGRVLSDVLEGYVSASQAESEYGVVLDASGRAVNERATTEMRAQMQKREEQG